MSFTSDQLIKCEKQKSSQDACQKILKDLLEDEDNKACADCSAKGTQWASWNLGLFLCIRCAGIHRNLGVHISKVKSIYLDSWSHENIFMLQKIGNKKGKEIYEAHIPSTVYRSEHDPNIEYWIRMKYEYKKFILNDWTPPHYKVILKEKERNSLKNKKQSSKHNKQKVSNTQNSYILNERTPSTIAITGCDNTNISNVGTSEIKLKDLHCNKINMYPLPVNLSGLSRKGITLNSMLWQ